MENPGRKAVIEDVDHDDEKTPGDVPLKRSGAWSEDDIETLIEMWNKRYSNQDIADALGRGANAIAIKASRVSLPPRSETANTASAKIRKCLRCRTSFHSHGAGNRICDTCKGSQDWQSGTDDYFMPVSEV